MQDTSRTLDPLTTPPTVDIPAPFRSRIIPKSFWLGGLKVNVLIDTTFVKEHHCIGLARYANQDIVIDPSATPLQCTEQTYLHELVHWIFYVLCEHKLRNDERIVDCFSQFLYQALSTAEPFPSPAAIDYELNQRLAVVHGRGIIPQSFHLAAFAIDVQFDANLSSENGMSAAQSLHDAQMIRISPEAGTPQVVEHLFYCQLIDWIFFIMAEDKLRANNRLIRSFAHLLYQALTTAEPLDKAEEEGFADDDDFPFDAKEMNPWKENEDDRAYEDYVSAEESIAMELYREERAEEEESEREAREEMMSEIADGWSSYAQSEDDGWYYGDED